MKVEAVKRLKPLERLCYWIQEREAIRLKKEAGEPKPWTDDSILQSFRFCCVRRMDDKVSRWLLDNWYNPNFDHPNMLPAIALARFINQPHALAEVGFPVVWDPEQIKVALYRVKARGQTVFNAAYMVRGNDGPDKIASVVDYNVQPLVDDPPAIDTRKMQLAWEALECRYGFGSFMAGQVVADLRWAVSGKWADRRKWAPMGPGSKRGLNRLLGQAIDEPMTQAEFLDYLTQLMKIGRARLPKKLTRRLEAHDWQNCCCEYDKYCRTLLGEGRPKQLYPGQGA